jgi:endo-alpha-1,4-polygalactosaminidase (GH114 family)
MKKRIYLTALCILLTLAAFSSQAASLDGNTPVTKEAIASMSAEQKQARIAAIKQRVDEIRAMDKSRLTTAGRHELRTELKSLKQESRMMGGVVYLSVGAVVIVILLLILLV